MLTILKSSNQNGILMHTTAKKMRANVSFVLSHCLHKCPLFLPLLLCCACASSGNWKNAGDATKLPIPISTTTVPYQIAGLDEIEIDLGKGKKESLQVSGEGYVLLNGENVRVKGKSAPEVESLVRRSFPQAKTVEIREFRMNRISVLGEVFHQIHTDLGDGPMRVMDALASANGFTPLANKRRVKLLRQNAGRIEVYELDLREMMLGSDLAQNLLLKPGDVITVPRNFL